MKNVITAHIEYSLAHDNREDLFRSAPVDVWSASFPVSLIKRLTLDIRPKIPRFPFPIR